jgi:succinate dehydrogenase/fumarate reductase flavoprotein subunit
VRNSFGDGCDITVKTGADLAKAREIQVTFAAFNSTKITSV